MERSYIYIVCSATPYRMGKWIRAVTGEKYNHISIALDEDLAKMYGFSRRFYRTPLYGGFNHESRSRYHINNQATNIQIYRLPVTQDQYVSVAAKLTDMYQQKEQYLYNHLSALGAIVHLPVRARNAYTCVEFGVEVLHAIGMPVNPGQYYSIADVQKLLLPYLLYTGPMPADDTQDAEYFSVNALPFAFFITLRDFLRLIPRAFSK